MIADDLRRMPVPRAQGNQARESSIRRFSASRTANISDGRRKRVRFTDSDKIDTFGCKQNVSSQLVTRLPSTSAHKYDEPKTSEYKFFRKLLEESLGKIPAKERRSKNSLMESYQHESREASLTSRKPLEAEYSTGDYFQKTRNRLLKVTAETWSLKVDDLISDGSNLVLKFLERLSIGSKQRNHELDKDLSRNNKGCKDHISSSSHSNFQEENNLLRKSCMLTATKKNKGKLMSVECSSKIHNFLSPLHENKENCSLSTQYFQGNVGYSKEMDFSMDSRRDLLTDMGSTYRLDTGIDSPWNRDLLTDSLDLSFSDGRHKSGSQKNKERYTSQLCRKKALKFFSPLHENKENCNSFLTWDSPKADAHHKDIMCASTGFRKHLTPLTGSSYFCRRNNNGSGSPRPIYFSDLKFSEVSPEGFPYRSHTDNSAPLQIYPFSSSLEPSFGTCNFHRSGFHESSDTDLSIYSRDLDFSEGSHDIVPYISDTCYSAAFQFSSPGSFLEKSFDTSGVHLSGLEVINPSDRKLNTASRQCPWPLLELEHAVDEQDVLMYHCFPHNSIPFDTSWPT